MARETGCRAKAGVVMAQFLYHGTEEGAVGQILAKGIRSRGIEKGNRGRQ